VTDPGVQREPEPGSGTNLEVFHSREMTTRTLNSAYSLYLMATVGGRGYRPGIDETGYEYPQLTRRNARPNKGRNEVKSLAQGERYDSQ
jgi:hypothetical protein